MGTGLLSFLKGKLHVFLRLRKPAGVMDFRPITVLGVLYRLWGSHHACRAIRALSPVLPDTLYGSRPACFAGQIWSQLLWAIEGAHAASIGLTGLVADLQKAFNLLPWLVVFEALAILGLPMRLLVAWAGALSCMGRRFQLGSHLTDPVYSSTGFPEGDGLF